MKYKTDNKSVKYWLSRRDSLIRAYLLNIDYLKNRIDFKNEK
jgi:hypothetical protein